MIVARGALMLAAATVGALHTLAPDHWVPFAALARANRWSVRQTARTTMLCGFGHVTVSALLAILVAFAGLEVLEHLGARLERQATFLLIAFGFVYLIWGLRRVILSHGAETTRPLIRPSGTFSPRGGEKDLKQILRPACGEKVAEGRMRGVTRYHSLTTRSLFVLFCLDPCVAVMPLVFAASIQGVAAVAAVIIVYEAATIATMVTLVLSAHAGVRRLEMPWIDRYCDAVAGAVIVCIGAFVGFLGI